MTTKHTPGPWGITGHNNYRAKINGPGWSKLAKVVIRMDGEFAVNEEGMANARLIAAAPELLAALEAFMDEANTKDVRAMARAAIAKVKGDQP